MSFKKTLATIVLTGALAVGGLTGKAKADVLFQSNFSNWNTVMNDWKSGDWDDWLPDRGRLFADDLGATAFHPYEPWSNYSFEIKSVNNTNGFDRSLFVFCETYNPVNCYKIRFNQNSQKEVSLSRMINANIDYGVGNNGEILLT